MKTLRSLVMLSWILFLAAHAQDAVALAELDEKTLRYYAMLQKKPENAPVLQRMIDAWLENGDQKQLLAILQGKAKAGQIADWRILAAASEYLGDDDAATKALDAALKVSPQDAATRMAHAAISAKTQNFDAALADLEIAMKQETLLLPAATLRGKLLAQTGRVDEAVKTWNDLITKFPEDIGLKEDLLDLLIQENLLEQALDNSRKLTVGTKDPYQKAMRRLRTAEILSLSGKKADASDEYLDILQMSAQDSWLERETLALAEKLHSAENDPSAWTKFLRAAIDAAPTRNALQQQLAATYQFAGKTDEAMKIHETLVAKNPGSRPIREDFIAFLLQAKEKNKAIELIRQLLKENPQDAVLWEQLATLHRDLNQIEPMETALAKAAALFPKDEAGALQSAQLYQRFEKMEIAEVLLRKAADEYGAISDSVDALAQFLFTNGKEGQAMELWQKAAGVADREGLLRIARALSAIGKHQQAADLLLGRIKDFPDDSLILSALCQTATLLDKPETLLSYSLQLVKLAKSTTDLESAIIVASAIIARATAIEQTITALSALEKPSIGELCLLAQLFEVQGDTLSSARVLDSAATADSTLAVPLRRISLLTLRGDLDGAISAWQKLIALPGGNKPQHWKELTSVIRRSGDIDGAIKAVQQWKSVAPGDKATYMALSELYQEIADPDKAVSEIRRMIAKFGPDAENRGKLIDVLLESGSNAEALRIALQLYDEAESVADKLKQSARIALAAQFDGKEKDIEALFLKRSRENTTSTTPLLALQEMRQFWQQQSGGYSDRGMDFSPLIEAMRRKPDDKTLILDVADRYNATGMGDKAEPLYRKVEQMNPTAAELRRIAAFYNGIGEIDIAEGIAKKLIAGSQNLQEIETHVTNQITIGDTSGALVFLDPVVKANPMDWRLSYLRGIALLREKRLAEAADVFLTIASVQSEIKRLTSLTPRPNAYNHYQPATRLGELTNEQKFSYAYSSTIRLLQILQQIDSSARQQRNMMRNHYSHPSMYGMQGQIELPDQAQKARHCAVHFLLYIAANSPEPERLSLLGKIEDPTLPILAALKTEIQIADPAKFVELALTKKTDVAMIELALSQSFGTYSEVFLQNESARNRRRFSEKESEVNEANRQKLIAALAQIAPDNALPYITPDVHSESSAPWNDQQIKEVTMLLEVLARCKPKARRNLALALTSLADQEKKNNRAPTIRPQIDSLMQAILQENPQWEKQSPSYGMFLLNKSIATRDFTQAGERIAQYFDSAFEQNSQHDGDYDYGMQTAIMPSFHRQFQFSHNYYSGQASAPLAVLKNSESMPGASTLDGQRDDLAAMIQMQGTMPNEGLLFDKFGYAEQVRSAMYSGCLFLSPYFETKKSEVTILPEIEALIKDLNIKKSETQTTPITRIELKPQEVPAVVKAIAKVKYPVIRCVILRELGAKDSFQAEFDRMIAADSTVGAESLLWAASYLAAQKGDAMLIYQLCLRSRSANLPRIHANLADAMLLRAAIDLSVTQKSQIDLDPARSAALRLSKKIQQGGQEEQKKTYADVLSQLGLKDAAKRLTAGASLSRQRSMSSSMNNPWQKVRSTSAQIATLMATGQKDTAARMIHQNSTSNNSTGYDMSDTWKELIQEHKLQKEYAAIATPPASASFKRRKLACLNNSKLLGMQYQRSVLAQLHTEDPDDLEIACAYLSGATEVEAQTLVAKIVKTPNFRLDQFMPQALQSLSGFISGNTVSLDDYEMHLGIYRIIAKVLVQLPASAPIDTPSAQLLKSAIVRLGRNTDFRGMYQELPDWGSPLIARSTSSKEEQEKYVKLESLMKKREAVMEILASACLMHAATKDTALSLISKAGSSWQGKIKGLDQQIIAALTAQGVAAFAKKNSDEEMDDSIETDLFNGNSYSNDEPPSKNVEFSLLSGSGKDLAAIATSIESALPPETQIKHQEICLMLQQPKADALAAYLQTDQLQKSQQVLFSCKILQLRGADLSPALFSLLEQQDFLQTKIDEQQFVRIGTQQWPFYSILDGMVTYFMSSADQNKQSEFFQRYGIAILGPEKHWPAYSKLPSYSNEQTTGALVAQYKYFTSSLGQFANTNDLANLARTIHVLRFLWTSNLTPDQQNEREMELYLTGDVKKNHDTISAHVIKLQAAGLFRFGTGVFKEEQRKIIFLPEKFLPEQGSAAASNKILQDELFKLQGEDALYAGLAALQYGGKFDQVHAVLIKQLSAIKKWKQPQQKMLASWLKQRNAVSKDPLFLAWLKSASSSSYTELEKELLTRAASSDNDEMWDEDDAALLLRTMIVVDATKTAATWAGILTSDLKQIRSGGFSATVNGINVSPIQYAHYELLGSYRYNGNSSDDAYQFVNFLSSLGKIEFPPGLAKMFSEYSVPSLFGHSYTPQQRIALHPKITDSDALGIIYFHKNVDDAKLAANPLYLRSYFENTTHQISSNDIPQMETWFTENFRDKKTLSASLAKFSTLKMSLYTSDSKKRDKNYVDFGAHFVDMMNDPRLPSSTKALLYGVHSNYLGKNFDPTPIAAEIMKLLPQQMNEPKILSGMLRTISLRPLASAQMNSVCEMILAEKESVFKVLFSDYQNNLKYVIYPIALKADHRPLLEALADIPESGLQGDIECIAQLITQGKNDIALSLAPKPNAPSVIPQYMLMQYPELHQRKVFFTQEFEKGLATFLPLVADEGQRYRMECLLSALHDGTDQSKPSEKWYDRMARLAKQFSKRAPTQQNSRKEILGILGYIGAAEQREEYQRVVGGRTLGENMAALAAIESGSQPKGENILLQNCLLHSCMTADLVKGDMEFVIKNLNSLIYFNDSSNENEKSMEAYTTVLKTMALRFPMTMMALEEDKKSAALQALLQHAVLASKKIKANALDSYRLRLWLLLGHAAAGRGADFVKNYNTLDEKFRNTYPAVATKSLTSNGYRRDCFWSLRWLPADTPEKASYSQETRNNLFAALFASSELLEAEMYVPADVRSFISSKIVSYETVLEVIQKSPDTHFWKPTLLAHMAELKWHNKGTVQEVHAIFEQAVAIAEKTNNPSIDEINAQYAYYLSTTNHEIPYATEIAKKVDVKKLRPRFDYLTKTLTKLLTPPVKK